MIIGTLPTSYKIVLGHSGSQDPDSDSSIILTFMDGSVEVVKFGARKDRTAEFTIKNLTNSQFITLSSYLDSNTGEVIRIQEENDSECIFTEEWGETDYYVTILEVGDMQEAAFSTTRELFQIRVKVALCGTTASSKLNAADSSLIDICIEIDTTQADYKQSSEPGSPTEGERWFDTDDNTLYKYVDSSWVTLYTVAADDSDYGFVDGTFYLSEFADISQDAPDVPNDYKSGVMNYKSVKFPRKSIDIDDGPNIERKEGFSLSIDNSELFWGYCITNNIPIHGSVITLKYFYNNGATKYLTTRMSGKCKKIKSSHTDYTIFAEPFVLGKEGNFPAENVDSSESRYSDTKEEFLGKSVYWTYGEFLYAALQNISTNREIMSVGRAFYGKSEYSQLTTIQAQINFNTQTEIYIRISDEENRNKYLISDDDIARINEEVCSIQVTYDTHASSSNVDEVRKILSITETTDFYILTINEAFPTAPTNAGGDAPSTEDYITVSLTLFKYQFQIDDQMCGGFGHTIGEDFLQSLAVYGLSDSGRELISMPFSDYQVNDDKNLLLMNPLNNSDNTTVTFYKEILPFESSKPIQKLNFDDIVQGLFDPLDEFDFDTETSEVDLAPAGSDTIMKTTFRMALFDNHYDDNPCQFIFTSWWKDQYSPDYHYNRSSWSTNIHSDNVLKSVIKLDPFANLSEADLMGENTNIIALRFPVLHDNNDVDFIANDNIRMCVNMKIRSIYICVDNFGYSRETPSGFKVLIRFKKKDNTYISNSEWVHEFSPDKLGTVYDGINLPKYVNFGKININNFPDGNIEAGGFSEDITNLLSNFDYQITAIQTNESNIESMNFVEYGDKAWNEQTGKLYSYDGDSWDSPGSYVSNGSKILLRPRISSIEENTNVYVVTPGSPQTLIPAVDGTDYNKLPVYQGRDIFDLSLSNVFGGASQWGDIIALEMLIVNLDYSNQFNSYSAEYSSFANRYWQVETEVLKGPSLYVSEEVETIDRPLFASVRGRTFEGTYSNSPEDIVTDIMESEGMYPNQWDSTSLTTLMGLVSRYGWKWRRQFTKAASSETVLKEILKNLWACVIINENDQLEFVSMNPEDHALGSPTLTFNETNIIFDSIDPPQFRDIDKIFQDFKFNFDYNIASEFSKAMEPYRKVQLINEETGSTLIKRYIEISKDIHNILNYKEMDFIYHYDGDSLLLAEWAAAWYVLNVWKTKFKVSISNIIGPNTITLMQYCKLRDYHLTNNDYIEGFVTSISDEIYDGMVEVGVHVYRPPGVFGPFCDNFNDALTTGRDISGWTDENGKINDAGTTGRNIGDYTIKDAGTCPRIIEC